MFSRIVQRPQPRKPKKAQRQELRLSPEKRQIIMTKDNRIKIEQAIIVEGRDDVDAVSRACDALIIPTHGYGISAETWGMIDKAYDEKGIIILTDPDLAGERIRKRLTDKYPDAIQCSLARQDALRGDDIGVENADPADIAEALTKALNISERAKSMGSSEPEDPVTHADLIRLGLAGSDGASELRARVCRELGIGYGNSRALLKKIKGFRIERDELEKTVIRIKEQQNI